jgi:hypothetical protein
MKNFRSFALIAFSFVFSGQVFAQNLITNGGFETSGAGWNLYIADTAGFAATVTYPTTGAAEGTIYAHVNVTKATVSDPASDNYKVQLQFPQWVAVKSANYKLSFKAKSSATDLKVGMSRGGSYAYVNGFPFTLTTAWQTYSCMFTSDTAGTGKLLLNFYVGAAVGTYDFDSVNLVQTGTTVPTNSLISNGGFELDGAGWGLYVQTPNATAAMTFPSSGAPEGSKYASVSVTATSDASQVQLQLPLFTAEVNAVYVLTYKARGAGSIEVVSQAGPPDYTAKESSYQDITSSWTTYSQTFTSDVAGSGALRINFWLGLAPGTYDFDSVFVVKSTVSIRTADAAAFPNVGKLTARKLANGMAMSVAGPLSQGRFSLGVYSPEGRMIKSVSGSRQSAGAIFIPMNMKRGTYLIRFTDDNGTIVKKMCWM